MREWSPWPAILLATLAGAIARAAPVLAAGFPVNDGGLFASFVDAILAGPHLLPDSITYNGLSAPFAYPPLAFLATAGLERLLPIATLEWLRWIPLAASIATIPAFAVLALEMAPTRVHAVVAAFAFALMPRSFESLVMGGGLARAPGMFLAIVAIYLGARFVRRGDRSWLGAGIALGLAVLTHPDGGVFAALSLTLIALAFARGRRAWARMIAAAVVGVIVTSPWLLVVIGQHGVAPLVSAGGVSTNLPQSAYYLLTARLTDEPFWMLTAGLAVLGFVYSLSARRYFVPALAVAVVVADPRAGGTYASVPFAILAAIGLLDVVVARLVGVGGDVTVAPGWPSSVLRSRGVTLTLGATFTLAMLSALLAPYVLSPMASLDADARTAMTWVRSSLPASARVVVVTGRPWYEDATSEWFPYLAGLRSVATVQGFEWMGASAWQGQLDASAGLQGRASDTVTSLEDWSLTYRVGFDYVYLPKGRLGGVTSGPDCCTALRQTLAASSDYSVAYDGPGASIFERRTP
jgi:Dolichyl-phosphate-mannose-protein mannosyltransferase